MEWKHIQSLLKKTLSLVNQSEVLKKETVSAVWEVLHFKITENQVKIKGGTIVINAHPALKNEILFRKKDLLGYMGKRGLGEKILDLR